MILDEKDLEELAIEGKKIIRERVKQQAIEEALGQNNERVSTHVNRLKEKLTDYLKEEFPL